MAGRYTDDFKPDLISHFRRWFQHYMTRVNLCKHPSSGCTDDYDASFEAYALEIKTWPAGIVEQQLRPFLGKLRTFDGNGGKKGTAYTQEDLDEDLALVDEMLELIRLHIFENKEVMRAWDFSQAGAPKDYMEKSGPPEIDETHGEVGSDRQPSASLPPAGSGGQVTYNLGGIRKEKIQPELMAILEATAAELNKHKKLTDFSFQIYSGGQPSMADEKARRIPPRDQKRGHPKETKDRTGSARHDYGWAADIYSMKNGRILSMWAKENSETPPAGMQGGDSIRVVIVKALLKNGIHSIGIGKDGGSYMDGNIHVDIATGNPDGYGGKVKRTHWGSSTWLGNIWR